MITAHLPSGYVLAKTTRVTGLAFWAAVLGGIFPDFDMFFFHFVDNRAFNHHLYWVHIPLFWAILAICVLPLTWRNRFRTAAIIFFVAVFMHLILDSIGGGILWGVPFSDKLYALVAVYPRYDYWPLSYILHWTFLFEVLIWGWAGVLFVKARRGRLRHC